MNMSVDRASGGLLAGVASLVLITGLIGCGAKSEPPAPPPPPAAPAPPPEPPAPAPVVDPNAAADQKLDTYSGCFNATNKPAHRGMSRYGSWVSSMRRGPTGEERTVGGVSTVPDKSLERCGAAMIDAANTAPSLNELDTVAKSYSAAITDWGQSLKQADGYYASGAYKDDAMAKGKAMHRGMVKNYDTFLRVSREFGQSLDDANDQRQQEQMSALEKTEGLTYNYWRIATMRGARRLVNLMKEDRFDITEATARLKAYEDAAERLTATAQLPEADEPAPLPTVEAYRTAAQQRLARVFEKKRYTESEEVKLSTDSESASSVEGSPANLIQNYNNLVGESNSIR